MKEVLGVKLYNLEELSAMLGISIWTAKKYVNKGTIESRRVGRRIFVTEAAIRRFVTEPAVQTAEAER